MVASKSTPIILKDDPIAPTEFPRDKSAAETTSRPLGRTDGLRHIIPRRRIPAINHALQLRRTGIDFGLPPIVFG